MHIRLRPRPWRPTRRAARWVGTARNVLVSAQVATVTSSGADASTSVKPTGGVATTTATANNAAANVQPNGALATVTATANNAGKTVAPVVQVATATATALDATINAGGSSVSANGQVATVTATANDAGKTVAPTLTAAATVTATANNAGKTVALGAVGVATCSATANNATITTSSAPAFPASVDSGGRYIKDQYGNPWMMHGEAAWCLEVGVSITDARTYLDDRASRGVNLVLMETVEHFFATAAPANQAGNSPFNGTAYQSTLTEAYWTNVDAIIDYASTKGITVMLFPSYLGASGSEEGWDTEIVAASNAQVQSYGDALGTRYKNRLNIIWAMGGDKSPSATELDRLDHIMTGITGAGDTHLVTAHGVRNHDAAEVWNSYSWLSLNSIYIADPNTISISATGYNRATHRPTFMIEGKYENFSGIGLAQIRREQWQAVLVGGLGGHVVGNESIWSFGYNTGFSTGTYVWQDHLADTSITHSHRIATLFDDLTSTRWTALAPDLSDVFLTSGEGSGTSQAAASYSVDCGLVYLPAARSINCAMSVFTGHSTMLCRWFDPTAGTYTAIGTFSASGTRTFTHPGANAAGDDDWVLVITAGADTNVTAESASGSGTGNNAAASVKPNGGVATCTATANNASIAAGSNTNATAQLASVTATANDATCQVKSSAGVATCTATGNVGAGSVGAAASLASAISIASVNTPSKTVAVNGGVATATVTAYQVTSAGSGIIVPRYVNRTVRTARPRSFRTRRPGSP